MIIMPEKLLNSTLFKWVYWGIAIASVFGSRWLLKSEYLYHWDSVQFALALEKFDLIKHQPHPPGYIIYILFARLINNILHDPNLSLIVVGILFSIIGLILIIRFTRELFGDLSGYIAGILYITNPAIWFHGLVAEVYIVETVWVLGVLYLTYRYWNNRTTGNLLWLGICLGLLGGIRQVAEITLLPVVFYVIFFHKKFNWREGKLFLICLTVTNLLWLVPLIYLTGGLSEYINALVTLAKATVGRQYAVQKINLVIENLSLFWQTIKSALSIQIPVLLLALLPFIAQESRHQYKINIKKIRFFAFAIIPGILILTFFIVRNPGYILYIVPLFLMLSAAAIVFISRVIQKWNYRLGAAVFWLLICALPSVGIYNFYFTKPLDFKYASASLASVLEVDAETEKFINYAGANFNPDLDMIFINQDLVFQGVRHLQYYLPEFDIYSYSPPAMVHDAKDIIWHVRGREVFKFMETIRIPSTITRIIVLANELNPESSEYLLTKDISGTQSIKYFDLSAADTLEYLEMDARFNLK